VGERVARAVKDVVRPNIKKLREGIAELLGFRDA